MFETVTTSVYFIWTIVYYGLYVSYKIGQFLVTAIDVCLENVSTFITSILELLVIITEAFTIFFHDIVQCFQEVYRFISYLIEGVVGAIITILCNINSVIDKLILSIMAVYNFIVNCTLNVAAVIGQTFVFIKRLVVLFGSGVWFVVTLIPLLVIYLGTLCTYYLGRMLEEIKVSIYMGIRGVRNTLTQFYEFLTDVPAESIAGIVTAICLAYIVVQFHIILYSFMYDQFSNIYRRIRRRYIRFRSQRGENVRQTTSRLRIPPRSRPQIRRDVYSPRSSKGESIVDERYCVICQERIKCILVLPCRHVCMCNECSIRLQLYNNTCPICRNDIESTMKIFV